MTREGVHHPARSARATSARSSRTAGATTTWAAEQSAVAQQAVSRCADVRRSTRCREPARREPDRGPAARARERERDLRGNSTTRRSTPHAATTCSTAGRRQEGTLLRRRCTPTRCAARTIAVRDAHREPLAPADPEGRAAALRRLGRHAALEPAGERARRVFPYAAGVFPFKREGEDPARMFAGEGGPERTNSRFHYVSLGHAGQAPVAPPSTRSRSTARIPTAVRTSTARSATAGVSHLLPRRRQEALLAASTSPIPRPRCRMTINGPAPMMLAFFLNAAIDQQCEMYIRQNGLEDEVEKKIDEIYEAARAPRPRYHGELPEGQRRPGPDAARRHRRRGAARARSTTRSRPTRSARCAAPCRPTSSRRTRRRTPASSRTEFALRMMGDVQQYFIDQQRAQLLLGVASAATTSPRPAPIPSSSSPSRWPTASPTWSTTCRRGMDIDELRAQPVASSSPTAWTPSTP